MSGDRRVALLAMEPNVTDGWGALSCHGMRRVQASLLADPDLSGTEVHVIDAHRKDVDSWVADVEGLDADLVGLAAHVWSFPTFIDVARRLRKNRPERTILLSGPSARPAMFALAPWRDAAASLDALVAGDELVFRDVVRLADRAQAALRAIAGLHLPTAEGWISTGAPRAVPLDGRPSPIRMNLFPTDRVVPLVIGRGAATSCATCNLGDLQATGDVLSADYLAEELGALRDAGAPGARILDGSLNQSALAFRNLSAAERRVGFFRGAALFSAIDAEHVHDEHLEFLRGLGSSHFTVRMAPLRDSSDSAERPFRASRFAKVIETLAAFTDVEVELILGLPGDSPAGFRYTLERARELPCKVRIHHCLVLPDDLMTRAPASFEMRFDPSTLMMRSCLGWSEDALSRERSRLIEMAYREGGEITPEMWSFPGPREAQGRASPSTGVVPPGAAIRVDGANGLAPAEHELERVMEIGIREATSGGWTFVEASARPGEIVVIMKTRDGALVVEMRPASPAENAYKVVDGVAFGYRSPRGARMSDGALRLLDRVLQRLHAPARVALGLSTQESGPSSSRVRRFPAAPS